MEGLKHLSYEGATVQAREEESQGQCYPCIYISGGRVQRKRNHAFLRGIQCQGKSQWIQTGIREILPEDQEALFLMCQ